MRRRSPAVTQHVDEADECLTSALMGEQTVALWCCCANRYVRISSLYWHHQRYVKERDL